MKRETIVKAGREVNLSTKTLVLFTEFFSERFPDELEDVKSYVAEWANRFKGEMPESYMDDKSLNIYNSILARFEKFETEDILELIWTILDDDKIMYLVEDYLENLEINVNVDEFIADTYDDLYSFVKIILGYTK